MKNLLIMRHAKSSRADHSLTDFDRPLNPRGEQNAPEMGSWLRDQKLTPDLIIASSAVRTQQTADLVRSQFDPVPEVIATRQLYLAPPQAYFQAILEFAGDVQTLLMLGHNPGIEQLVYNLSNRYESIPTATIAWFQFDSNQWREIRYPDLVALQAIWRPKEVL